MKKTTKKKLSGMIAAIVAVSLLSACGKTAESEEASQDILVDVQTAELGDLTLSNSFVGTISAQESVYVIPRAQGTVTDVYYNVGDRVNAGDVLFKIDDEYARLTLEQAELSAASVSQQANMTMGSQQDSTDLQLEASKVQAQSSYEQAQIGYYLANKNYDTDDLDDKIDGLKKQKEALENQIKALSAAAGTVSGNDPQVATDIVNLKANLSTIETTISSLKQSRETLESAYLQARSGYKAAEAGKDITNKTANLTQGAIREDTQKSLNIGVAQAQNGVKQAQYNLNNYTVESPISGTIIAKTVEVNGMATSSSPAFTIANEDTMTVTFSVGESVMNTLSVGDTIEVERNGAIYTGHITEIGVAVNQQTGLFQIKANVEANGNELPAGVSVKLSADTYKQNNSIIIPYDSVYYDNDGAYVYLAVNGAAKKTYVTTGIFDDTNISVTGGIDVGDVVITSWSPRLLDGVGVRAAKGGE